MSLIGKSIGNYQIKAKLGEGGMGAVYLGEHPLIGKRVAVKVLLEELAAKEDIVSRFFTEAKAVNDIGHQNIVDIVDFGKTRNDAGGDLVYFIMEFLDGESLAARLRRTGLSRDEAMHVMAQCCSALSASHAKGIVHRDLKPENIYLCTRGSDKNFVKILDFGIAKLTGDGGSQSHKTRTGLVIGTPAYMSPEQCEGKGLIDHRSDVYSLGIVMYELLTGRVPFPGEGFGEILVAHLTKQPDPPSVINPDIPAAVEAIVMRAIEKDRNRRFQTMEEFARAVSDPTTNQYQPLPAYATGATATVEGQRGPTTGMGQRPTTLSGAASEAVDAPARKSKMPLVAAVAGVVVIGAGAALMMSRGKDTKTDAPRVPAVMQPSKPDKVKVTVTSDPPGAQVFRGDTGKFEEGKTPLTFSVKRGEPATFDIRVKLDGYKPGLKTINTDEDVAVLVPLDKDTPAPPPVVATPTPTPAAPDKATADKPKKDRHHGSSTPSTDGKKKSGGNEGGGDDMKLLQPKF